MIGVGREGRKGGGNIVSADVERVEGAWNRVWMCVVVSRDLGVEVEHPSRIGRRRSGEKIGISVSFAALRCSEGEVVPVEKARRKRAEVELQGKVLDPGWAIARMAHEVGGWGTSRDLKMITRVRQTIAECKKLCIGGSRKYAVGERRRQNRSARSFPHASPPYKSRLANRRIVCNG